MTLELAYAAQAELKRRYDDSTNPTAWGSLLYLSTQLVMHVPGLKFADAKVVVKEWLDGQALLEAVEGASK